MRNALQVPWHWNIWSPLGGPIWVGLESLARGSTSLEGFQKSYAISGLLSWLPISGL